MNINGHAWLVYELLSEGIHVASPILDRRDALAYLHSDCGVALCISFSLVHLSEGDHAGTLAGCRASPLTLIFSDDPSQPSGFEWFALTPAELASMLVIHMTAIDNRQDCCDAQLHSEQALRSALRSFEVGNGQWRRHFVAAAEPSSQAEAATIIGVGALTRSRFSEPRTGVSG